MTDTPKIRIRGLRKSFGDKVVLDDVNLSIEAGESLVIIGGSGSGKSVMLKCILGLLEPDDGEIEIDGEDITRLRGRARDAVNRRIGMLFQGAALFDSLPVWENVAFGLIQSEGTARKEARDIAIEKLELVGLDGRTAKLYPAELSGGMKKRVALARSIATEPEIVFFDEPTTGLDPIMGDVIDRLIVDAVNRLGATALSITHDMASARRIAHRIAMLYEGRIIWDGAVEDVDSSGNDYVDQFINGRADGPITVGMRA